MRSRKNSKRGKILVISGCAGSGKGTVIKEIMKMSDKFAYSVSMTTRAPRPEDKEGESYIFVSKEKFREEIEKGSFLEYAEYCGNYYGTPKSFLYDKISKGFTVILEIDTVGAQSVIDLIPKKDRMTIFLSAPNFASLKSRLVGRGTETPEVIERRMETARSETRKCGIYDHVVINDDGRITDAAELIFALWKQKVLREPMTEAEKEKYSDILPDDNNEFIEKFFSIQ